MANGFTLKNADLYGLNMKSVVVPVTSQGQKKSVVVPFLVQGNKKTKIIQVPDPGGDDADIADRVVWVPTSGIYITKVRFIRTAASTKAPHTDAGDDLIVLLEQGSSQIVKKTYTADLQTDPTNAEADLGTVTYPKVAAGTSVLLSITQGANVDIATTELQIEYLEVGDNMTDRAFFQFPNAAEIVGIYFIGHGTMVAAAHANDLSVDIEVGATEVLATPKLFTSGLAADTPTTLGTLSTTGKFVAAGADLTVTTVQEGTSVCPDFALQVDYYERPTITGKVIFTAPQKCEIVNVKYIGHGTMAAAAVANDLLFEVKNPTGAVGGGSVTLITKDCVAAIAAETPTALGTVAAGTLDDVYLDQNEKLTLDVTPSGTAVCPDFDIQIDYVLRDTETLSGP